MPPVELKSLVQEIAGLEGQLSQANALTPSRLLRLSKNLPHDWKEQRCFLGFAAETSIKIQPKRSTSDDSKTASETLRPFAPRTQTFGVSGCRRCLRRVANARKF